MLHPQNHREGLLWLSPFGGTLQLLLWSLGLAIVEVVLSGSLETPEIASFSTLRSCFTPVFEGDRPNYAHLCNRNRCEMGSRWLSDGFESSKDPSRAVFRGCTPPPRPSRTPWGRSWRPVAACGCTFGLRRGDFCLKAPRIGAFYSSFMPFRARLASFLVPRSLESFKIYRIFRHLDVRGSFRWV